MEENEKKVFVSIENYTGENPIEVVYREDTAQKKLEPIQFKMPESFLIEGTIDAPVAWLEKRINSISVDNCHVEVCKELARIKLIVNETNFHEAYNEEDMVSISTPALFNTLIPRSAVSGYIDYSDEFKKLRINADEYWSPVKLAKYLRLNRHLFADKEQGMAFISILKNIKATVTGQYEKKREVTGGITMKEFFEQNIDHNLPKAVALNISIFKGGAKETYEVELDADYIDNEIRVSLVSPAMNEANESARDLMLNEAVEKIKAIAPTMVIIEK